MKILHLSDLHFGSDKLTRDKISRKGILDKFKELLRTKYTKEPEGVDFIVVSGDLAYKASANEYKMAEKFLKDLAQDLNVANSNIILCPGNHDKEIERKYFTLTESYKDTINKTPQEQIKKFQELNIHIENHRDNIRNYVEDENYNHAFIAFANFNNFCEKLELPEPKANFNNHNYSSGYHINKEHDIAFVIINSALLALGGNNDYGKLELFPGIVDYLFSSLWEDPDFQIDRTLVVSVLHHNESWLNWTELYGHDKFLRAYEKIVAQSSIIFSGHEHGSIREPDFIANKCQRFIGGSTYVEPEGKNQSYINNFSIIKISESRNYITRETAYFNSSVDDKWKFASDEDNIFPITSENFNHAELDRLKTENETFKKKQTDLDQKLAIYRVELDNWKQQNKLKTPDIFGKLELPKIDGNLIKKSVMQDLEDQKLNVAGSSSTDIKNYKINNKHVKFFVLKLKDYLNTNEINLEKVKSLNKEILACLNETGRIVVLIPYVTQDEKTVNEFNFSELKNKIIPNDEIIILNPYRLTIKS